MANRARRAALTRLWLVVVLGWSVLRTLVVAGTLARYGVHPLTYGAIDLAASGPYAVSTAGLVASVADRRPRMARRCALVAATAFVTPDGYLLVAGRRKPTAVYAVVLAVALSMASLAVVSIIRQLRRAAAHRTEASAPGPSAPR